MSERALPGDTLNTFSGEIVLLFAPDKIEEECSEFERRPLFLGDFAARSIPSVFNDGDHFDSDHPANDCCHLSLLAVR